MLPALAVFMAGTTSVGAAEMVGDLPLSGLGMTQNGANPAVSSVIHAASLIVNNTGSGDYAAIASTALFSNGAGVDPDLNSLSAFTFSNASWGTFVADGANNQVLHRSSAFLSVYLTGTFTGAGALSSFEPSRTSLRVSVNQSGLAISEGLTLNSPPTSVPEPSTYAFAAIASGLVGLISRSRRKTQLVSA